MNRPAADADGVSSMGRRAAGYLLTGVGALMLVAAAASYASGALASDAARARWEALQASRAVAAARAAAGLPRSTPVVGAPVARLIVPRLGMDEIVVEGVGTRELRAGPGHVPGTALPGSAGNAVVSAHRDRHFQAISDLTRGDTIVTESDAGRVVWVVTHLRVVDAGAPALFDSRDATLTLTTCWPIRLLGPAPDRLIVTARPIVPAT